MSQTTDEASEGVVAAPDGVPIHFTVRGTGEPAVV
jgi:hypothetical protein